MYCHLSVLHTVPRTSPTPSHTHHVNNRGRHTVTSLSLTLSPEPHLPRLPLTFPISQATVVAVVTINISSITSHCCHHNISNITNHSCSLLSTTPWPELCHNMPTQSTPHHTVAVNESSRTPPPPPPPHTSMSLTLSLDWVAAAVMLRVMCAHFSSTSRSESFSSCSCWPIVPSPAESPR